MFASLFRTRAKHARLPQGDSESNDSETLLSSDSSSPQSTKAIDRSSRDIRVAVKAILLCTLVYIGAGAWIAYSVQNATFVADADDFCMHRVSRYCKSTNKKFSTLTDKESAGRERCEARMA
jgi:hypothetical protein